MIDVAVGIDAADAEVQVQATQQRPVPRGEVPIGNGCKFEVDGRPQRERMAQDAECERRPGTSIEHEQVREELLPVPLTHGTRW